MIISEEYKFIFLKPYKVAGSSLEFALSSILSSQDIITFLSKDEEQERQKLFRIGEQNNRKKLSALVKDFSKQNKRDLQKLHGLDCFILIVQLRRLELLWAKVVGMISKD